MNATSSQLLSLLEWRFAPVRQIGVRVDVVAIELLLRGADNNCDDGDRLIRRFDDGADRGSMIWLRQLRVISTYVYMYMYIVWLCG